jgi:phosphatidate phosphatase APP1
MWYLVASMLTATFSASASDLRSDEVVVFYPSYATLDEDGQAWTLLIHGSVYRPGQDSVKRAVLLAATRGMLGVKADDPQSLVLDLRLRPFLVDHQGNRQVKVRIGSTTYELGKSGSDGRFSGRVRLPVAEIDRLAGDRHAELRRVSLEAVMPRSDPRRFTGRVELIRPEGLSCISDIDDTIKITEVRDRKAMLANTLVRDFRPVPGMAELYRELAESGVAFHYVSGSPWQLYEPLAAFCRVERFPPGTFHLKYFRLTDPTALAKLTSQEDYKPPVIESILAAFPRRQFVLIGDSGEKDPEIYGKLARQHGRRIAAVFVRNVSGETPGNERMQKAFAGIAATRWQLFQESEELRPALGSLIAAPPRP